MVAKVVCGKSIRKVLYYNENKVGKLAAELMYASGFLQDGNGLSFRQKLDRFRQLTSLNERTKTNAMHISLNFSRRDILDNEKLQAIALDYMERIGWGDQPFLLYQHFDAAHPHVHLVTTNINRHGERMETHNIGKNQSERARKEIEQLYNLIKAEEQQKENQYSLKPVDLQAVIYGKSETKAAISEHVREVMATYKFTSLPEYNAILRQFNIYADRGDPGSAMYEHGGLVYRLLDEDGNKAGIPIKASSIFSSPTLKNIEIKFKPNESDRKPYGQRLKHLIDKAFNTSKSLQEFEVQLQKNGVRALIRYNVQGNASGLTLIDNATRCCFKGSDLGKQYSVGPFLERLEKLTSFPSSSPSGTEKLPSTSEQRISTAELPQATIPAANLPVIMHLWDIALSDRHEENTPEPRRKKRKWLGIE
ncbi:relaxase/mobilization nuclease domain-containing protein [Chitinophaga sp. RCC_12]|uniref:relaxase/mobilization nuclease domain-containing protein n=1 Tax=Chitinophaga sp. RCC_12 TaxID=3239226 RepID=UPI003525380E